VAYRGGKAIRDVPADFGSFWGRALLPQRGRDPRAHRRSVRLGLSPGQRRAHLARRGADDVGCGCGAVSCRAGAARYPAGGRPPQAGKGSAGVL